MNSYSNKMYLILVFTGILYGTMTMELGGKVTIDCKKTNYVVDLEFKLKVWFNPGMGVKVF